MEARVDHGKLGRSAGSPEQGARRLTLDLDFSRLPDPRAPLSVHVIVEDIAEADALAPVLFETETRKLEIRPDGTVAPLVVDLPEIKGEEPAIRVHVDLGATGIISAGDFINSAVVWLPREPDAHCKVPLIEVR
jgi:hypothetical protein